VNHLPWAAASVGAVVVSAGAAAGGGGLSLLHAKSASAMSPVTKMGERATARKRMTARKASLVPGTRPANSALFPHEPWKLRRVLHHGRGRVGTSEEADDEVLSGLLSKQERV
jgi:hypothetical protein